MKIYVDNEFKCHTSYHSGYEEVETKEFDGKCDTFIEGYRFIPSGKIWIRNDGKIFTGEMISPCKPWRELDNVQRKYEREQLEAVKNENDELLSDIAAMVDAVYESDLERIES